MLRMDVFLTPAAAGPEEIRRILAEAFRVPVSGVDVSEQSEVRSRNGDALVTCEYEHLARAAAGDLSWVLGVYAAREVERRPAGEALAVHLAGRLRVPVFHTWDGGLPWINRVALPGGGVTLARVAEPGGPEAGFSVEAAEAPITGMPHVPVLHLPEVVRAFPVPTPLTERCCPRARRAGRSGGLAERRPAASGCVRGSGATGRLAAGTPQPCTPRTWRGATHSPRPWRTSPTAYGTKPPGYCGNWTASTVRRR
ncbi:hypothetical protein CF54_39250 [Streptomyces sp. Tu 6176]|nr:hypothetical protein CF54_39250 [Streptomyces sp. Tu 6176]